MKKFIQILALLLYCLSICSCEKDEGPTEPQPLSPGTATIAYNGGSAGSFYCKLDQDSNLVFNHFSAYPSGNQYVDFEMKICKPLVIQQVELGLGACPHVFTQIFVSGGGDIGGTTNSDHGSGFINITYVNFSNKTVSGTFEAHLCKGQSAYNWGDLMNGQFTGTW